MSNAKTKVDPAVIRDFLHEHYDFLDDSLEHVEDGEISQAFFFTDSKGKKVIRVNSKKKEGFLKDKYAYEHFSSGDVPIPRILETGELPYGLFYSVSERAPGKTIDKFSLIDVHSLIPKLIKVLEAVHSTKLTESGFGSWQPSGDGEYTSWRDEIVLNMRQPDDKIMLDLSFYDHELHEDLVSRIKELVKYCPEERKLVHADFGFNNVISNGRDITGVVDWENSKYGDPLYDVAWLQFWGEEYGYEEIFREYYSSKGNLPKDYEERILCYKFTIGYGALCFFAKSNQRKKYEDTIQIITKNQTKYLTC